MSEWTIVHMLTSTKDGTATTGCGQTVEYKGALPSILSGWHSDVTCAPCSARAIYHQAFTKESLMTILNAPNVRTFHFTGKRWWFRWPVDASSLYIFDGEEGKYAMGAIPVAQREDNPITYEDVQNTAREWISEHDDNYIFVSPTQNGQKTSAPAKPKAPPAGPHCHVCWKKDEGDLLDDPNEEGKQICMTDFVTRSR